MVKSLKLCGNLPTKDLITIGVELTIKVPWLLAAFSIRNPMAFPPPPPDMFSEEFTGEKILTFVEFLDLIKKYEFSLQLEIKHMHGKETEIVDEIVNQIQPYLDYFKDKLFVSGFSEKCLRLFSKKLPQIPLALALSFVPKNPDLLANEVGVDILHFGDEFVDDLSLEKLKNSKTEFAVATVNDKKRAEYLLSNGVQSVLTDNPEILN